MKTLATAALTALLLTLTACGGGEGGAATDEQRAADAIADAMMSEQDAGTAGDVIAFQRSEADCVGEQLVDGIGTEKLQEYGFLTEELESDASLTAVEMSTEDAQAATDALFQCVDVVKKMGDGMADAQAGAGAVDEETLECLQGALSEDRLREMFTLVFSGENEKANQAITAPMMACVTPQ